MRGGRHGVVGRLDGGPVPGVPLGGPHRLAEPGLRGYAKIDGGSYTLAWWLVRWWNKVFNFQL